MKNKLFMMLITMACIGMGERVQAQTYEQFVEKSFDLLDQNDLLAAGESLKAAMRLEPANPNNYALLMNLGTIIRSMRRSCRIERNFIRRWGRLIRR